ncbi:MAG: ribosome hibernation-promoting factor, HPF/YfiA family [Vicinamibacterales bacterium]
MRFELTGRQVEITLALRRLVDRKLVKLDRKLKDAIVSGQVVLTKDKYRHVADITLHVRGDHVLHGLGEGTAWEASLGQAVEKLEQQATTLKGKWTERKRRATPGKVISAEAEALSASEPAEGPSGAGQAPRIVPAPSRSVKPMTVEEAALVVADRKEAFVVFRNAVTNSINVLYRRRDGQLGLIEPEI